MGKRFPLPKLHSINPAVLSCTRNTSVDALNIINLFLLLFDNTVQILNAEFCFQQRFTALILNSLPKVTPNY